MTKSSLPGDNKQQLEVIRAVKEYIKAHDLRSELARRLGQHRQSVTDYLANSSGKHLPEMIKLRRDHQLGKIAKRYSRKPGSAVPGRRPRRVPEPTK